MLIPANQISDVQLHHLYFLWLVFRAVVSDQPVCAMMCALSWIELLLTSRQESLEQSSNDNTLEHI